jgi:hypothetical protein
MARTIESPGVQISEVDLSRGPIIQTGTSILVAGFAPQGPTDEIIQVTSLSEFANIYGQPQTPAERYFYHSVAPLFNTSANVYTYKLPYGSNNGTGFGAYYGALVYPCSAINIDYANQPTNYGKFLSTFNAQTSSVMYVFGRPTHFELTKDQYDNILQNSGGFSWKNSGKATFSTFADLGNAGMIVLNKAQTTVNNTFEGYYVGMIDNSNLNPATNYDGILEVQTVTQSAARTTNYLTVPSTRLNFSLSSLSDNQPANQLVQGNQGLSVSLVLENASQFNIDNSNYDDVLTFGLFKLKQSVFSPDTIKLDYVFSEKYIGSLDYWRQINTQAGGQPSSFFIETREDTSPNVNVLVNEFISHKNGSTWLNTVGVPSNKVRLVTTGYKNPTTLLKTLSTEFGIVNPATADTQVTLLAPNLLTCYRGLSTVDSLFTLGAYSDTNAKTKNLGSIPLKLDRMFDIAENTEVYNLDISLDAGVSTIFAVSEYLNDTPAYTQPEKYFDDTIFVTAVTGLYTTNPENITTEGQSFRNNYATIFNRYANFAGLRRKDHLYIGDLPRNIFVQGQNFLPLSDPNNNFSLNVYSPIRNVLAPFNTSYSTVYANWAKVFDTVLDDYCWVPFSGFAAAAMANTDAAFQPWFAPAGFVRGNVFGTVDLALYPKQKQRDQLYKINANPVAFFPNEGFVIYGQKTLLKQPSAFDRINVRRLFLNLEKSTASTVKFFVFEPNTLLTRTRIVNALTPIFENAKNTEGLYDYLIVCDERNNTPAVIDANELVVDIYLKPVRTAEFILVNFYATRTSTNFQELVG